MVQDNFTVTVSKKIYISGQLLELRKTLQFHKRTQSEKRVYLNIDRPLNLILLFIVTHHLIFIFL